MPTLNKIVPCLWYDKEAEEAARFYCSVFKNSEMGAITRYTKEGFEIHKKPEGSVMTVTFYLEGQEITALNGGPIFKFNEAVSFMIDCKDQGEVDHYWSKLTSNGGQESQCGWCKDRFGLSWQVTPRRLTELLSSKDPVVAKKAMEAMMPMRKIDIAALEKAVAR